MRTILKLFLGVALLTSAAISHAATCPDVQTAIDDAAQLTTLNSPTSHTNPSGQSYFLYTGATSLKSTTINYYTLSQPTQVTPVVQVKRLASAFQAATPQAVADGSTSCVYLGAMSTDGATPTFTAPWNQVIQIIFSGSVPPPPPPPGQAVAVSTNITGLPSSDLDATVKITLTSTDGKTTISATQPAGTHSFSSSTVPSGTYSLTAAEYTSTGEITYIPTNIQGSYSISGSAMTIAITYGVAPPVSGEVIYHITFPYSPSQTTAENIPLDTTYTDLIMANYVAGTLYGHLIKENQPALHFNQDYLQGSLMAQLMQENNNLHTYPTAKAKSNNINIEPEYSTLLLPGQGGPYQINNYSVRLWDKADGGIGIINFIAMQQSLGYTIAMQDCVESKGCTTQTSQNGPAVLENKYFGPIAAAYFQYTDLLQLAGINKQYGPQKDTWGPCMANASIASNPIDFLEMILNASYNAGSYSSIITRYIGICAAPTQNVTALQNIDNYMLDDSSYNKIVGGDSSGTFILYPRQVRFYLDELYNNTARLASSGLVPNNSMPFDLTLLRTVFANSMHTLAYVNTSGTYNFISAIAANAAFDSARASLNLTGTSSLNLSVASERAQIFALLDAALTNVETSLNFKFTATTEKDLWK
ncbi:MAG: hypothetical protein EXR81_00680 [Gammaproteobacteria bacterium]|nr:hypothetical protein [Gammaproteobacteria bacterium]